MSFGVITLENDDVPEQLNFTHCTAHGVDGEQSVEHGEYADLASDELARLKGKFPSVFEEPTFPVDRSGCEF